MAGKPAKHPSLYGNVVKMPTNRQTRELSFRKLDARTREGRLVKEFRRELTAHVGGDPTAVERALIEQCCALRLKTAMIDAKILSGTDTALDASHYLAWSNTLRRALASLNYGEVAGIIRKNAEAKLLKAYSR